MNVLYIHAVTCVYVFVCVGVYCVSFSSQASTVRLGLCYHCNELGICSLSALSLQSTGRWSCRESCPPLPLPLASSALSVQTMPWHDWPASSGATCRTVHAGLLPLCAATVKEERKAVRASCPGHHLTHYTTWHNKELLTHLSGLDQRSSAVHVILRVHYKHHLVGVEFKSAVQTPGVLDTQLAVPLSPAAHRLHLSHLPATETPQVPTQREVKRLLTLVR